MYPVEETELAGIGRRFVVVTSSGSRLVIIMHDSGMVELYYSSADEQQACPVATFTEDEARLVAAIIGRTIYRPEAVERLNKYGLAIRWQSVKANSYAIGKTLGEVLKNSGVVVLAVIDKDGKRHASPPGDFVLQEGSQIALSGSSRDIEKIEESLDKGQ